MALSNIENCPVAALASESRALFVAHETAELLSDDRVRELLWDRIEANALQASNLKAASQTGALYQIGLIAYFHSRVSDDLCRDEGRDNKASAAIERMAYSVAAFLESGGADLEQACADRYMPEDCNPHSIIDRLLAV